MPFGCGDPHATKNQLQTEREPVSGLARFVE
jgi:hypothetical protein